MHAHVGQDKCSLMTQREHQRLAGSQSENSAQDNDRRVFATSVADVSSQTIVSLRYSRDVSSKTLVSLRYSRDVSCQTIVSLRYSRDVSS